MAASDYAPIFFKNRLHLAGRPQMGSRPNSNAQSGGTCFSSQYRAEEYGHGASEYLEHELLGPRLIECTRLVMAASEKPLTDILGSPDDMKFRSCMTLFDAVSKQAIFAEAIAAFYPDGKDRATLENLETSRSL